MHYVYVLHSVTDNGFYIGYSANLRRRFSQHVEGAALATSFRGPWKLIYYEAYVEEADAVGRERYLKSGAGRKFLTSQLRNYLKKHPVEPPRKRQLLRGYPCAQQARPRGKKSAGLNSRSETFNRAVINHRYRQIASRLLGLVPPEDRAMTDCRSYEQR